MTRASLPELAHVQGHLAAQDALLTRSAEKPGLDPVPVIDPPLDETGLPPGTAAGPARSAGDGAGTDGEDQGP